MQQIVTITSQGQLTIPASFRQALGITAQTKATIKKVGSQIIVEPEADFWSLGGSLHSNISLDDHQLKTARNKFQSDWANHD